MSDLLDASALVDLTPWTRILATGPDILDLLHRLSTADVKELGAGQGRRTVLTSAKGRIVAVLTVHRLGPEGVLLLAGPTPASAVMTHLARFTFAESTGLEDRTATTGALAFVGPDAAEAARRAGLPELDAYSAVATRLGDAEVWVARTNGIDAEGYLVVFPVAHRAAVSARLLEACGGRAADATAFEAWRVLTGRGLSGAELTEEHNPLEGGLRDAVSFTKGCYVGQEVVARLNTYDKVARTLVRLELDPGSPVPAPGAKLLHDGREVGSITSAVLPPGKTAPVALGYVKTRDLGGDRLQVAWEGTDTPARIVSG